MAIIGVILFLYLVYQRPVEGFQSTESRSVDLVVARYKENLEWLNNYKDSRFQNVFIYNKSDSPVEDCVNEYANCVIKTLPNVGVCDHTYLYHIIENYDSLADVTVFAPGSADLEYKANVFKTTIDKTMTTKDSVLNVYKFDIDADKAMYNFRMINYIPSSSHNRDRNDFKNVPASPTPFGVWYRKHFPEVHTPYSSFLGIFAVSKEHVHQRPKSFYKEMINQVNTNTFHEASHFIERAWFSIFWPVPEKCIHVSPVITDLIDRTGAFRDVRMVEGFQDDTVPTFHILIATAGRPTLKKLLDSLKGELTDSDAITIVFDGPGAKEKSGYDESWFSRHMSQHTVIVQDPNLGAGIGGEPIRTKYQTLLTPETTYIMHADDDDEYIKGSFEKLRNMCSDPEVLYIAKMRYSDKPGLVVPSQNTEIVQDDIGTPNGIIPFHSAGKVKWGMRYGGDFDYYNALSKMVDKVVFLDLIIYTVFRR
jgi:hypothetical protein